MESLNNSSDSKIKKSESFVKSNNKDGIPNKEILLKDIINKSIPDI